MDVWSAAALGGFLIAVTAAAAMGAIFPPGTWYANLRKPSWRPPNWLFGPAWTFLYVLIALSGWLLWRTAGWPGALVPLAIYVAQLALNALWTPIFFGLHRPDLAFAEIVLMWLAIATTIAAFAGVDTIAALLLVPYLAWVTFAAALNFSVWQLNRGRFE